MATKKKRKSSKRRSGLGEIRRSKRKVRAAYGRERDGTAIRTPSFSSELYRTSAGGFRAYVCTGMPKGQRAPARSRRQEKGFLAGKGLRCGEGQGTTPTRAVKKALTHLAKKLQ